MITSWRLNSLTQESVDFLRDPLKDHQALILNLNPKWGLDILNKNHWDRNNNIEDHRRVQGSKMTNTMIITR